MSASERISVPKVSLPKGGGAIKGIGETFQPNPFTGTANLTIPIYTTPCRDFEPRLSLTYSSGNGNGIFGIGFSLSIPNISRKTEKGLPKYLALESDTFIISNAEDLVPRLVKRAGQWVRDEKQIVFDGVSYRIIKYRPCIEGLFANIELWMNLQTGDIHWEVISKDNVKSIYGRNPKAKILDPENPAKIFMWLVEEISDAKGNKIIYEYKGENEENVPNDVNEASRTHTANKYLKKIRYGNYFDQNNNEKWAFEVVFDYGEHDLNNKPYLAIRPWSKRKDSFSSYKAGFEIRTHRLCRHVLMFHIFDELGNEPCLVRSIDFQYDETPVMTYLKAIKQTGYRKNSSGRYDKADMPPLEFNYSTFDPEEQQFKPLVVESGGTIPGLIDQSNFMMVDLHGESISGILYSDASKIMYWRGVGKGVFAGPQTIFQFPIEREFSSSRYFLMDLGGDGKLDLVASEQSRAGYYQSNPDGTWQPFKNFESFPLIDFQNPKNEKVDLNGDGFLDVLAVEDNYFSIYPSKAKKGYDNPVRLVRKHHEDAFPDVNWGSREETTRFADMFGDGLSHRVRIRNGVVECWPNLGYGHWGKRVLFGNGPQFDEKMDPSRLFLADIDGSGTADLIYVQHSRIYVYFNQSGNSFSNPVTIPLPQGFDNRDRVQVADVLGNGTSCLVITKNKAGQQGLTHDYYDFTGGIKPHLLIGLTNNMGSTTRIKYCSSTKFYLDDEKSGKPWISKLPFPVHVIEKTETIDHISGSKLVALYKYHHGFYDGEDREFRGFGCVEQWDTESFEQFSKAGLTGDVPFEVTEEGLHVPPTYTRTWYHTGAYEQEGVLSRQYEKEYYAEDPDALLLPDSVIDTLCTEIDTKSVREAYRALRGQVLRQEVYAEDDTPGFSEHPYTVSEASFKVRMLQPKAEQRHAVLFVHSHENITYHYERNPRDPRIEHQFTLEVDKFGNVLQSCNVFYPRREARGRHVYPEQAQIRAIANLSRFINETVHFYLLGVTCEYKSFEIGGLDLKGNTYFTFDEIKKQIAIALQGSNTIHYEEPLSYQHLQSRLLFWQRHYYWNENQDNFLPLCCITKLALLHNSEETVLSTQMIQNVYGEKVTDEILVGCGYRLNEKYWWNPSRIQHYYEKQDKKFYLPSVTEDAYKRKTKVEYDDYCLVPTKIIDPLDNITEAEIDYHVLMPRKITDINDNVSEVLFDALGFVKVTSVYGEENGRTIGDQPLKDYQDVSNPDFEDILQNQHKYIQNATSFFFYDLFAWQKSQQQEPKTQKPMFSINLLRETHVSELTSTGENKIQFHITYSDGFGREIQKKTKVEDGKAFLRDPNDNPIRDDEGNLVEGDTNNRWLVSGRTVYSNKASTRAKPVKQYEPFFSSTPHYEQEKELTEHGVTPIIHYDPLMRVVCTDSPKGFFSKVEFSPWMEKSWDENDTVTDSKFYAENINNDSPEFEDEKDALAKARRHYNTPKESLLNNLGQRFLSTESNLDSQLLVTYFELDIQGNELSITDSRQYTLNKTRSPQDRVRNFVHIFDMSGTKLSVFSVDAGLRLTLNNIYGQPVHSWNSRGFHVSIRYDELQRPLEIHVQGNGLDQIVEKMTYGEGQTDDKKKNLRGQLIEHRDQAGIEIFNLFDIKGKVRISRRQLRKDCKDEVNWNNPAALGLENEVFTSENTYDAIGRIVSQKNPDESIHKREYHPSGLLRKVEVTFENEVNPTIFIENIEYNAKGQREKVIYGNGIVTEYAYERETFRLKRLKTFRNRDGKVMQDIFYTYDPVGNITRIADYSHHKVFHNQNLEPLCDYTYDAIYQLKVATGREHPALSRKNYRIGGIKQSQYIHLNDVQKLQKYRQIYTYDASRNLTQIRHYTSKSDRCWTANFIPSETSNRTVPQEMLQSRSSTPDDFFDENGNMIELEHLRDIRWNYRDNIASVDLIQRDNDPSDSEYYVYNSEGNRVKKVFEQYTHGGSVIEIVEKIYLGNCEIKRIKQKINNVINTVFERKSLHVMDDKQRFALVHHWTQDDLNRETENVGQRKVLYQMSNHLGSCSLELSNDTEIISYEEYFPYGETSFIAGKKKLDVSSKEYRYSGKERDITSLYYYGARYYASWMCRWVSCDPMLYLFSNSKSADALQYKLGMGIKKQDPSSTPSFHMQHAYCAFDNNPVKNIDLTGRKPTEVVMDIMHFFETVGKMIFRTTELEEKELPLPNIYYRDIREGIKGEDINLLQEEFMISPGSPLEKYKYQIGELEVSKQDIFMETMRYSFRAGFESAENQLRRTRTFSIELPAPTFNEILTDLGEPTAEFASILYFGVGGTSLEGQVEDYTEFFKENLTQSQQNYILKTFFGQYIQLRYDINMLAESIRNTYEFSGSHKLDLYRANKNNELIKKVRELVIVKAKLASFWRLFPPTTVIKN